MFGASHEGTRTASAMTQLYSTVPWSAEPFSDTVSFWPHNSPVWWVLSPPFCHRGNGSSENVGSC